MLKSMINKRYIGPIQILPPTGLDDTTYGSMHVKMRGREKAVHNRRINMNGSNELGLNRQRSLNKQIRFNVG